MARGNRRAEVASGAMLETAPSLRMVGARSRRWVPSLLDCCFLAVMVWLFATGQGGWLGLLADADAGEYFTRAGLG